MIREIFLVCLAATLALNDESCYCGQAKRISFGRTDEAGDRIVGGKSTEVNEYPWQALVVSHVSWGNTVCGGSVISDNWVLTAATCLCMYMTANCVYSDDIDIYLGEYNNRFKFETKRIIMKGVPIIHPNWSK